MLSMRRVRRESVAQVIVVKEDQPADFGIQGNVHADERRGVAPVALFEGFDQIVEVGIEHEGVRTPVKVDEFTHRLRREIIV